MDNQQNGFVRLLKLVCGHGFAFEAIAILLAWRRWQRAGMPAWQAKRHGVLQLSVMAQLSAMACLRRATTIYDASESTAKMILLTNY